MLRKFEGIPGQFLNVVGVFCNESDSFAVPGKLCRFPRVPDAFKTTADVRVCSIHQAGHPLRRRARGDEVCGNVISEQVL